MLNMQGRSSEEKDEFNQTGTPSPLLGVMDSVVGGASEGDSVANPMIGSPVNAHTMASLAEGACQQEKYSLLVCIFTARDRRTFKPHAWAEDLLKDFFQLTLGINLLVTLLSLTECLIFCGNCTKGQGMSWDELLHYAHQLMGVHPWTGYTIDVVALQCTLKEACHHILKTSKMPCTDYSYELSHSRSELDEVHTLELPLLMFHYFINNLVQFKCLWKGVAQPQLKFLWRGLGSSSFTCRSLWLTCRRTRVLRGGEVSWSFLHKG